jgi:hypothetical protein
MGLDISCHVVAGVPLASAYRHEVRTRTVTKFNPDNGQPYQKEIKEEFHFLGNREMTPEEWRPFWNIGEGLEFWKVSCGGDPVVFGQEIGSTPSHRSGENMVLQFSPEELAEACQKTQEMLLKYGILDEVEIYYFPHFSV